MGPVSHHLHPCPIVPWVRSQGRLRHSIHGTVRVGHGIHGSASARARAGGVHGICHSCHLVAGVYLPPRPPMAYSKARCVHDTPTHARAVTVVFSVKAFLWCRPGPLSILILRVLPLPVGLIAICRTNAHFCTASQEPNHTENASSTK